MKFNTYQAIGRAAKIYNFTKEEKEELNRRVLEDKPYDKSPDRDGKYRAVMGYAKQLRKELDSRIRSTEMIHTPEGLAICEDISRPADEVRNDRIKYSNLVASARVAAIMDEA